MIVICFEIIRLEKLLKCKVLLLFLYMKRFVHIFHIVVIAV